MNPTIVDIAQIVGLIACVVGICFLYLRLEKIRNTYKDLAKNGDNKTLEDLINSFKKQLEMTRKDISQNEDKLKNFIKQSKNHFQKIAFKRFNPFGQTGGDQSFVLVLLDARNNGFIIQSLHQRDVTRVYAKDIKEGKCEHNLSKEEKDVLKQLA